MDLLPFVRGCTFDDFLFAPQHGILPRRDPDTVDLSTRFSVHVVIKRPTYFRKHGHNHASGDSGRAL